MAQMAAIINEGCTYSTAKIYNSKDLNISLNFKLYAANCHCDPIPIHRRSGSLSVLISVRHKSANIIGQYSYGQRDKAVTVSRRNKWEKSVQHHKMQATSAKNAENEMRGSENERSGIEKGKIISNKIPVGKFAAGNRKRCATMDEITLLHSMATVSPPHLSYDCSH